MTQRQAFIGHNDIFEKYKLSNNQARKKLLKNIEQAQLELLYNRVYDEMLDQIHQLEIQNNAAAPEARAAYYEMVSLRNVMNKSPFNIHKFSNLSLLDAALKTTALIQTIDVRNEFNPQIFAERSKEFTDSILDLKKEAKDDRFWGVMNALMTAVAIAGVIGVLISSGFTFGLTLALLPIALISLVGSTIVSSPTTLFAHTLFKRAKQETSLAHSLEKLHNAVEVPEAPALTG